MNKRETEEFLAKKYAKQMRKPSLVPKELAEKIVFYKVIYGKAYKDHKREIYRATLQEFSQPYPHYPYGWLALYDDYTEKDVVFYFHLYKAERIERLRARGVKIRKFLTENSVRDFQWIQMAKKYKNEPSFKKIAQDWSKKNPIVLRAMVLQHLWQYPDKSVSLDLENLISTSKKKRQEFEKFIVNNEKILTDAELTSESEDYVESFLPRTIRSAVYRFRKKPY